MTITVPFSTPLYFVFTSNNCLVHTECIPLYHILYLASQQSNLEIQSVVICISLQIKTAPHKEISYNDQGILKMCAWVLVRVI